MTKLILIFGLLLFFVNTIFGVLLSDYLPLNCLLVCAETEAIVQMNTAISRRILFFISQNEVLR